MLTGKKIIYYTVYSNGLMDETLLKDIGHQGWVLANVVAQKVDTPNEIYIYYFMKAETP